jgi:hypothetical protein
MPLVVEPASCWPGILSDLFGSGRMSLREQSSFDPAVEFVESVQESEEC